MGLSQAINKLSLISDLRQNSEIIKVYVAVISQHVI